MLQQGLFLKLEMKLQYLDRISDFSMSGIMKEWREEKYPPWAHGPGYVVSSDIAKAVSQRYKKGSLKVKNNLQLLKCTI